MKIYAAIIVFVSAFMTQELATGSAVRHSVVAGNSQTVGAPYVGPAVYPYPGDYQPARPAPKSQQSGSLGLILLLLAMGGNFSLFPTTTTTTTTAAATTSDMFPGFSASVTTGTPAVTCRYMIVNEKLTWDAASARCATYTGGRLAYTGLLSATDRAAVLAAAGYQTGVNIWVGLSDTDSALTTHPVRNLANADLSTSFTSPAPIYASLDGTRGCGYHSTNIADPFFSFNTCFQTTVTTPSAFMCEVCP